MIDFRTRINIKTIYQHFIKNDNMTNKIITKFAKKGINLSPDAYFIIKNSKRPVDLSSNIIIKLKSGKYSDDDLISVDEEIVKGIIKDLGMDIAGAKDLKQENRDKIVSKASEGKPAVENKTTQRPMHKPAESQTQSKPLDAKPEVEAKPTNISKPAEIKPSTTPKPAEIQATTTPKPAEIQATTTPKPAENKSATAPKPAEIKHTLGPNKADKKLTLEQNPSYPSEHVVTIEQKEASEENKHHYVRNDMEITANFDNFKIIKDTSNKSYTNGDIGNLIEYFQSRYNKLAGILSKRPELRTFQKINELNEDQTDLNLILMITEIRTTKNGHYLLECEDDTGSITLLISKDNAELMESAVKLMKDEVIGVIAERRKGNDLAICQRIIDPGVPRMPKKDMDFGVVFTSDIHIGSTTFLDDAYSRFIKWINGDFGNEEQMEMANNVKYMIVGGDIVDGIGVYPNQDAELAIKDITAQYDEAARFLGDVRSDVKIIITPGNHDASRVAEPQPAVPEKYAKSLYELKNTEFISNPGVVSLDGINVLIYHGRGIDDMVMGPNEFSHERNDLVMKEFLNKRHLAPLYGERTPLASELEDHLVIDQVPDVLHTGHVHINTYTNYKGIHCINSGTFQTQTEFQKIHNIMPTPAEVPILNNGVYKQLKFI